MKDDPYVHEVVPSNQCLKCLRLEKENEKLRAGLDVAHEQLIKQKREMEDGFEKTSTFRRNV